MISYTNLNRIAHRLRWRACNWCREGQPGICRNSAACQRALADADYLVSLASRRWS
jgi:hypothetical protein